MYPRIILRSVKVVIFTLKEYVLRSSWGSFYSVCRISYFGATYYATRIASYSEINPPEGITSVLYGVTATLVDLIIFNPTTRVFLQRKSNGATAS